jgi:K+-transporting ATPase KdpF subunit
MSGIYTVGAILAILLFVYLFLALLKPEWFA